MWMHMTADMAALPVTDKLTQVTIISIVTVIHSITAGAGQQAVTACRGLQVLQLRILTILT